MIIIGGGPAGEAAARTARKKKIEVLLIEKEQLGGLCLNWGCIPTKTLLSQAKKMVGSQKNGLKQAEWQEMKKQKDHVVRNLRQTLERTLSSTGIQILRGEAKFEGRQEIMVSGANEKKKIPFDQAIIAVGSAPIVPTPFEPFKDQILSSDKALQMERIPPSMLVIGGGAVGCEFACLFHELGCKITIIEKLPNLLPGEDDLVALTLKRSFETRGIKVATSTTVETLDRKGDAWEAKLSNKSTVNADEILLCVGRSPNCKPLDLEKAGIEYSSKGIDVDATLNTSNKNVYSVGDVTGLSLLAHSASVQGEIAAANASGEKKLYDGALVPRCLYSWPEVASVGIPLSRAKERGIDAKSQRFFLQASGRALCEGRTEGFIQIVSDEKTDRILGGQILGQHATELIHILSIALKKEMTRREMRETIFAHPTLAEGIRGALEK